jgi:hypothetical protein
MNRDDYWALIDRTRAEAEGDGDRQAKALQTELERSSLDDVIDFERHTRALLDASYTTLLWGAAYLINGGCSDDGFDYFRGWLVAQGRATYEAALKHPDTLADYPALGDGDVELEGIWYVASRAYEAKTGKPMPDGLGAAGTESAADADDADFDFDDDAAMREHFPKLYARFVETEAND